MTEPSRVLHFDMTPGTPDPQRAWDAGSFESVALHRRVTGRADGSYDRPGDGMARALVLRLLGDVLEARRAGNARLADGSVRRQLQDVCGEAQQRGLPVEQILVTLKREWRELPDVRRMPRTEATETLARVITLCIHEYYGDDRSGAA